ncbi:MAG: NAD(P)/FAD-dependent oxidoreductase [Hyphomicrobiales bacterium]|nr:NAD(P)/FAD-dependent oxidoreductase [Hyphomicrobiales bacterium]MCP5371597.1 NAD(P)/FAD-dependent oxidoreductase [Hyphomicrobiales bacterium]
MGQHRGRERDACDAVIVGGGHNGLTCAAYLARAGLRVRLFERRPILGGAAVTEEFHPGFRNSTCAYTVGLLDPGVMADLDLAGHGLRILRRPMSNFLPLDDGGALCLHPDPARTRDEVARLSPGDAGRLADYEATLDRLAGILRDLARETPPNAGGGLAAWWRAYRASAPLRRQDPETWRDLLDLFTLSAAEFLERWFAHDAVKALFAFDAVVGTYTSPFAPGSAYVLLHHCFGQVDGARGVWGHAVGGMGAVTAAMARAAEAAGAVLETDAPVARVLVADGRAAGVELADGRRVRAPVVAANVNPRLLLLDLVPDGALPAQVTARMGRYRCASGTLRMNVALRELPDFTARPGTGPQPHHGAGIVIAPSLDYMDRAYQDARRHGFSRAPIVELLIPSVLDDSLAPPGRHVASLFCQHFDPELPGGASWDDRREAAADAAIAAVTRFAPNFAESIIARRVLTPLDLEREFALVGGDIFHGAMRLNQMFSARPLLGLADYRMPLTGLYLCGAGAHPGGGVTALPGRNAAREILRDRR